MKRVKCPLCAQAVGYFKSSYKNVGLLEYYCENCRLYFYLPLGFRKMII